MEICLGLLICAVNGVPSSIGESICIRANWSAAEHRERCCEFIWDKDDGVIAVAGKSWPIAGTRPDLSRGTEEFPGDSPEDSFRPL